jgi:hypothetical protein
VLQWPGSQDWWTQCRCGALSYLSYICFFILPTFLALPLQLWFSANDASVFGYRQH